MGRPWYKKAVQPIIDTGIFKAVAGEMSRLRVAGGSTAVYVLDSSRVDYATARQLYANTIDSYKLGAGFAKPIIDTAVGFMGIPSFVSADQGANDALEQWFSGLVSERQQVQRDAMRDGDCWVWLTYEELNNNPLYPEVPGRIVFNIVPPEMIQTVSRHPVTGDIMQITLKSTVDWVDVAGSRKKSTITQAISAEARVITVEGDMPPDYEAPVTIIPNRWGFIPIVQFRNEWDGVSNNGVSDFEAVEPFFKAYHDLMLSGLQGCRVHSTPRLKLKLSDAARFLALNFGVQDPEQWIKDGKTINLEGHDIIVCEGDDDAAYIEPQSGIGATDVLLKILFYCIVDASETPEFAFGVHTPSSLSSVKEQMPLLIRRISRKREQFTRSWQMVARMALAMMASTGGVQFATYDTALSWDVIDPRSDEEVAGALEKIVNALAKAVDTGIISQEAAVNYLAQRVGTMNEWQPESAEVPGERDRIIKDQADRDRSVDARLGAREIDEIHKALSM
jgi:hypothetical protein